MSSARPHGAGCRSRSACSSAARLEKVGGYVRCGPCSKPQADRRNFYVYPYDFRLDNVHAARGLHELIERIRADYGDPRQPVDVLAHSNGGLLVRYYARYGTADLPDSGPFAPVGAGAHTIRRLLLVGTPNLGTMQPVLAHLRGAEMGLRKMPREVGTTFSSVPQLMPHPALPWILDVRGHALDYDLYDIETWRSLGWSMFDARAVERAAKRHGGGAGGQRHGVVSGQGADHGGVRRKGRQVAQAPTRDYPRVACWALFGFNL